MNKNVIKFCSKIEKEFKEFVFKQKDLDSTFVAPTWQCLDYQVTERIMRLNYEKNIYKIDDDNDLEMVAIATLKQDFINNYPTTYKIIIKNIKEYMNNHPCNFLIKT